MGGAGGRMGPLSCACGHVEAFVRKTVVCVVCEHAESNYGASFREFSFGMVKVKH